MSAKVVENLVDVVAFGRVIGRGTGYTAWCDECADEIGVNWHGPSHVVGYESAPNMEAILDAEMHNDEHHPESGVTGSAT